MTSLKCFTKPFVTPTENDSRLDDYDDTLQTVTGNTTGITLEGNISPYTDNTYNNGASDKRWNNVYTTAINCAGEIDGVNNMKIKSFLDSGNPYYMIGNEVTQDWLIIYTAANHSVYWGHTSGEADLGTSVRRWKTPYSVNALNTSSDVRMKKNIKACNLGMNFIDRLKPVCYEYNTDPDGYTRLGFIAQDVQDALKRYQNMSDNALLQEDENEEDPEHPYLSMGYTELLAPLVSAVQDLSKELKKIKKELANLKNEN